MDTGDIPKCLYDKTGEKFSLDQGKRQGHNQKCQSCFHKMKQGIVGYFRILKKFQKIKIHNQQDHKRKQGAFAKMKYTFFFFHG